MLPNHSALMVSMLWGIIKMCPNHSALMVDYVGLERDWRGQAGVVAKTFIDLGLAPSHGNNASLLLTSNEPLQDKIKCNSLFLISNWKTISHKW